MDLSGHRVSMRESGAWRSGVVCTYESSLEAGAVARKIRIHFDDGMFSGMIPLESALAAGEVVLQGAGGQDAGGQSNTTDECYNRVVGAFRRMSSTECLSIVAASVSIPPRLKPCPVIPLMPSHPNAAGPIL